MAARQLLLLDRLSLQDGPHLGHQQDGPHQEKLSLKDCSHLASDGSKGPRAFSTPQPPPFGTGTTRSGSQVWSGNAFGRRRTEEPQPLAAVRPARADRAYTLTLTRALAGTPTLALALTTHPHHSNSPGRQQLAAGQRVRATAAARQRESVGSLPLAGAARGAASRGDCHPPHQGARSSRSPSEARGHCTRVHCTQHR